MSELRSKCCGAKVHEEIMWNGQWWVRSYDLMGKKHPICSKCHKPCQVEEKNKPQDTALYASLRR